MNAVFAAIKQFCNMFMVLFSAGEKAASILDVFATSGHEMAQSHLDQARYERKIQRHELEQKLAQIEAKTITHDVKPKVVEGEVVA